MREGKEWDAKRHKTNKRRDEAGDGKRRKVDIHGIPMLPEAAACGPHCETSFND